MKNKNIAFYVAYPYYFPHFLPIAKEFEKINDVNVTFVLCNKQNPDLMVEIVKKENFDYLIGEENLFKIEADFIFFANIFKNSERLKAKKIFMDHGVGTKACNFKSALETNDIVLVEGDYRETALSRDFPLFKHKIKKVGFSKLDQIINTPSTEIDDLYKKYKLDRSKKTILYAPTFFPSSVEKMSDTFPNEFINCNIIVKPHYLSLERRQYKNQQNKFKKWKKYNNCTVCDLSENSLIPFIIIADLMISDESSAIFEFTALNKPVILNKFLKLRWSYYLFPNKLRNRMDRGIDFYRQIGDNAFSYCEMVKMVNNNLQNPQKYEGIRKKYTRDICGIVDGNVSKRIVEILLASC